MTDIIDARGLSCPQPVLMTLDKIKSDDKQDFTVIVDTVTSRENVIRAANSKGWESVDMETDGEEYKITLKKK